MAGDTSRQNGRLGGRPPGSENEATKQKRLARQRIRDLVWQKIDPLIDAQLENALGVSYLVLRQKDGSYTEATDAAQVKAAIAAGDAAFKVYTRQPHQPSAAMLLAYAADKPVEPVELTGEDGGPLEVAITSRLLAARKRLKGSTDAG
jgi:hypothetical protein